MWLCRKVGVGEGQITFITSKASHGLRKCMATHIHSLIEDYLIVSAKGVLGFRRLDEQVTGRCEKGIGLKENLKRFGACKVKLLAV